MTNMIRIYMWHCWGVIQWNIQGKFVCDLQLTRQAKVAIGILGVFSFPWRLGLLTDIKDYTSPWPPARHTPAILDACITLLPIIGKTWNVLSLLHSVKDHELRKEKKKLERLQIQQALCPQWNPFKQLLLFKRVSNRIQASISHVTLWTVLLFHCNPLYKSCITASACRVPLRVFQRCNMALVFLNTGGKVLFHFSLRDLFYLAGCRTSMLSKKVSGLFYRAERLPTSCTSHVQLSCQE